MSLDSRMRLARKRGTGARLHSWELQDVCEGLKLLRACERAERSEAAQDQSAETADTVENDQ